jgi:hypothetical protein
MQKSCGKEILVELGLQSAHDMTLKFLNRNHTVDDFVRAVSRLNKYGCFAVGAHLILGLPGESFEEMLQTIRLINRLGIDHVKFHHLQVIKDTSLHAMHREKPLKLYDQDEYLTLLAELVGHLASRVVIHRLWSTADPEFLVGPRWDGSLHFLQQRLLALMTERGLYQGRYAVQ